MTAKNKSSENIIKDITRTSWLVHIGWTLIIGTSLLINIINEKPRVLNDAKNQARTAFEKDVLYRSWSSGHGGVYVPITENTPPNPYLSGNPERDITTSEGKKLTLLNPAYMTRQVHELGNTSFGTISHITSLDPIRPENYPNDWEKEALLLFQNGEKEYTKVGYVDGKEFLNLMKPLLTEKSCLKCHGHQGYEVGDVRGGISVSIPLEHFYPQSNKMKVKYFFWHLFIWTIGILGFGIWMMYLRRSEKVRILAISELKDSEQKLRLLFEGTSEMITLADKDAKTIWANPAWLELFGSKEYNMQDPFKYMHSDDRSKIKLLWEDIIKSKKAVKKIDYRYLKPGGGYVYLETSVFPVKMQEGDFYYVISSDISERKRAEEELDQHRENLEGLIKERTSELQEKNDELERFNKVFVGREFRIKELRDEIKALKKELDKE